MEICETCPLHAVSGEVNVPVVPVGGTVLTKIVAEPVPVAPLQLASDKAVMV